MDNDKNAGIHLRTALTVSWLRLCAGVRRLADTPTHTLISMAVTAMLVGLWLHADAIVAARDMGAIGIADLANAIRAPLLKLLTILLAYMYVMLCGIPRGAMSLQMSLQQAGIMNAASEVPYLIGRARTPANHVVTVLTWYTCGIPLATFEEQRDRVEAALNAYIIKISVDRKTHHVIMEVVFGREVQPELPPWNSAYIPQQLTQFAMGVDLAGTPIIADLSKIPHVLIGGSTGSGKSYLLKLMLYQAVRKGYEVYIADFKGGLDFLGPWENYCQMCLDKVQVLDALSSIYAELNRRKQLFRGSGCRDIEEYNGRYPMDTVDHIIFACDEASAVFSRKQALKDEAGITKEIEAKAAYIAAQGRALGIHLVLSLQRPDATVLDGQITNNIDYRVCGRANQVLSKIVLDQTDAKTEVPKDSNGVFLLNDGTIFQSYRIDESTLWHT